MFTKKITESDAFLDMPTSTQALYFHLCMSADDDGFVSNPKTIKRIVGASDDDMKLLLLKRFIISFESGIIVIKHWRMHNYIAKDRYRETEYIDEKNLLFVKPNKSYTLTDNGHKASDMSNSCIQNVDSSYTGPYTQNRIDKNSIEEDSIDKTSIDIEEDSKDDIYSPAKPNFASEIIDYLNQKAGTHYRTNVKKTCDLIKARMNEGFTVDDFKKVIDNKCDDWLKDERMSAYLRPVTLFGTKFESYLNEKHAESVDDYLMRMAKGLDEGGIIDEPTGSI